MADLWPLSRLLINSWTQTVGGGEARAASFELSLKSVEIVTYPVSPGPVLELGSIEMLEAGAKLCHVGKSLLHTPEQWMASPDPPLFSLCQSS